MAGAGPREKIDLRILSPSPELRNGVTLNDLSVALTIGELRIRLQEAISSHPAAAAQRLIYRGRALVQESATLLDIFGRAAIQEDALHTIHLVLADRPNNAAAPTPTSQPTSNAPSNPFTPASGPPNPSLNGQAGNPFRPPSAASTRQGPQVVLLGPNGVSMPLPANGMPGGSHADIMTAIANQQAQQMQNAAHQQAMRAASPAGQGVPGAPPPELAGLPPFVQQQIQAAQAQFQAMHQNLVAQQAAQGQPPASPSVNDVQQPSRSTAGTPRPPGFAPGPGPSPFQQFITQQQQERAAAGMQGINSSSEPQREAASERAAETEANPSSDNANQASTQPQVTSWSLPATQPPVGSQATLAPAPQGPQPGHPHFHPRQQHTFTFTSHNFDPAVGTPGFPTGFQQPGFQASGQLPPQFMMPDGQIPAGMHFHMGGNRAAPLPQPMMFHWPDQAQQGVAFAASQSIGAVLGRYGAIQVSLNTIDPLVQLLVEEARQRPLSREELNGLQARRRTLQQEFDSTRAMAQQIMQNTPRDVAALSTLAHLQSLEVSLLTRLERIQASLAGIERGQAMEMLANTRAAATVPAAADGSAPGLTEVAIGNAAEDVTSTTPSAGATTQIDGNIMSEMTITPTPTVPSATQPIPSQPASQPAAATIPRDPTQTNVFLVNDPQGQPSALIVGSNTTHTTPSLPPQIMSALLASRLPVAQLTSVFNDVMRESLQPRGFLSHNRHGQDRSNPYQYNYRQSTRSRTTRPGQSAPAQTEQERRQADYEWATQRIAARQGRQQELDGLMRGQEAVAAQAARIDATIARAREVLRRHNADIPEPYDPENNPNFTGEPGNNAQAQLPGAAAAAPAHGHDIPAMQNRLAQQEAVEQNLRQVIDRGQQQLQNLRQEQQQLAARQPDEMRDILAPIVRNLWLIIRIIGVVWFFASGGRGYVQATGLGLSIVIVYAIQNGYIALPRGWIEGARNWWRDLLDPAHVANAFGVNGARVQGQPQAVPTPEDTARRLLLQRQRQGWLSNRSREYIRSAVLLVASLIPGLGEDYVRQVEERLRREREEIERLQREAEEAAPSRVDDQQQQLQITETPDAGSSTEQQRSHGEAWSTLESEVDFGGASSSAVETGATEGLTRVNKGKGRVGEVEPSTVESGEDGGVASEGPKLGNDW